MKSSDLHYSFVQQQRKPPNLCVAEDSNTERNNPGQNVVLQNKTKIPACMISMEKIENDPPKITMFS